MAKTSVPFTRKQDFQIVREHLPRLQSRSQNLIPLIFGGLKFRKDGNDKIIIFPESIAQWFTQVNASITFEDAFVVFTSNSPKSPLIHLNSVFAGYLANVLILATVSKYTQHRYIQISQYQNPQFYHSKPSFPHIKSLKCLYYTNLNLLLLHLIELTTKWDSLPLEDISLELVNIDLLFPTNFWSERDGSSIGEIHVIVYLSTQIFLQTFLEGVEDWDTRSQVSEIFKLENPRNGDEEVRSRYHDTCNLFAFTDGCVVSGKVFEFCENEG